MLLIRYNDNWADEMDIFGIAIIAEEKWDAICTRIKETFEAQGIIYNIGTNEDIEYEDYDQWIHSFKATPLTLEQATIVLGVLNGDGPRRQLNDNFAYLEGFFALSYDYIYGDWVV
jgi:hypothetical protein